MSSRILLVEDEPSVLLTLTDLLGEDGYLVESATEGNEALARAANEQFDLLILDVMLPGRNGFEVCRELREHGNDVAVLMLTARTQVSDRVAGLKIGADDYLTKPFEPRELLARVEALLRRRKSGAKSNVSRFSFGNVVVNFETGDVKKDGAPVNLAGKELELLRYLIERRGTAVSRDKLLEDVWEYQRGVSSRTVDVHVAWLRQKLEENPQFPRHIHTVRGIGYRFSA